MQYIVKSRIHNSALQQYYVFKHIRGDPVDNSLQWNFDLYFQVLDRILQSVGLLSSQAAPTSSHTAYMMFSDNNHTGWLRNTVGRTPVFGQRTDPVLHSACSWRVTITWVNRPLQVSQIGQLSLSSFRDR